MGPQPTNTPHERATYRIKRTPSSKTEEFLKVDISIRGGTSYLPSEARRIHTPPGPAPTQDGGWKGFFFDYNAPRSPDSPDGHECDDDKAVDIGGQTRSRATTEGQKLGRARSAKCKPPGDWYDVKLAELDGDDERIQYLGARASKTGCEGYFPAAFPLCHEDEGGEQFDHTIPEHLPSSPLCPRNPRYWRVVKGKGSQFRGCWMHGVGEYDVVPGVKKPQAGGR